MKKLIRFLKDEEGKVNGVVEHVREIEVEIIGLAVYISYEILILSNCRLRSYRIH